MYVVELSVYDPKNKFARRNQRRSREYYNSRPQCEIVNSQDGWKDLRSRLEDDATTTGKKKGGASLLTIKNLVNQKD